MSKQKRLFTEVVDKIKWANKLSAETINLSGDEFQEIQVFEISLKKDGDVNDVMNLIDKFIPYPIIFEVHLDKLVMFSASKKHTNPLKENNSVIDWRFSSKWIDEQKSTIKLNLKGSLDDVYFDFCLQLIGKEKSKTTSLKESIEEEQKRVALQNEIAKLEATIKNTKQYNKKVELNLKLGNILKSIKANTISNS